MLLDKVDDIPDGARAIVNRVSWTGSSEFRALAEAFRRSYQPRPIRTLKALNAWFAEQFSATIDIAVLRNGAIPRPGTQRRDVKCKKQSTAVSIKDDLGFKAQVSTTKTVSKLKLALSEFVKIAGEELKAYDFIIFLDQRVARGKRKCRKWRARSASKPAPKRWTTGQKVQALFSDGVKYPATIVGLDAQNRAKIAWDADGSTMVVGIDVLSRRRGKVSPAPKAPKRDNPPVAVASPTLKMPKRQPTRHLRKRS